MLRSFCRKNYYCNLLSTSSENCDLQCWKCHKFSCAHIFCDSCKTIQPVSSKNDFFSYMGLNRKFIVNELELKTRFLKMQSFVHPDKYGQNTEIEKKYSQQHSSYLNRAYKTLRDPLARANYLLGTSKKELKTNEIDEEYAMQIMELNEEIDSIEDKEKLEKKLESVDFKISNFLSDMEDSFSNNDITNARRSLNKMRYLRRTKRLIETKLGRG